MLFLFLCFNSIASALCYTLDECELWEGVGASVCILNSKQISGSCKTCQMGTLYHENGMYQDVAVLSLKRDRHRRILRKEYDLSQQIDSPHVLPFLNYFIADGVEYLVAPRYNGDLKTLLKTRSLSIPERLSLANQMVEIVRFLHERNITHGDLAPNSLNEKRERSYRLWLRILLACRR